MVFVPCPNVVQLEAVYTLDGESVENVYHILMPAAPDAASMDALINDFIGWENATAKSARSNGCALTSVHARDLTTSGGIVREELAVGGAVGTVASPPLPNNVSLSIKSNTGFGGRSFRGRTYWIGLSVSQQNGNAVAVPTGNAIVAVMDALITAVSAVAGRQMVVLSRRHNNANRAAGVATPIINYSLKDYIFDSQRRRLPFHNRHH